MAQLRIPFRVDAPITFLAVGQTLAWASIYYVFPALLLRWETELGWSKADLTGAITLSVLISALTAPLAGRFIDRGHGAALIGVSASLGGIGLFLLSGVTEKWHFYGVWLLIGLSMAGCLYDPCFSIVTRTRGAAAKRGIIFITLAAGFASTLSFPTVFALSEAFGWRAAVQALAFTMVLIVAPILWLGARQLEGQRQKSLHAEPDAATSRAFLRRPAFWFLTLGLTCLAIAHGATIHHLLPLLDERGISAELAILVASLIGPMQVAGRLAMMASERYLSNHGVTLVAFLALNVAILILLTGGTSHVLIMCFVVLFGGAYGTVSILRPLLVREILGGSNFGAKSGALALPYLTGSAAAPYLGSLVWNIGGYAAMLAALLGFMALGTLLYEQAHRRSQTS